MKIGTFHAITLTATPLLASGAAVSGSALLAGGAVALALALVSRASSLRRIDRTKRVLYVVHGLTGVCLIVLLSLIRKATIDPVLLIVMLGIFNRFVLRGGQRDDFLIVGASTVLLAAATTITPGIAFFLLILVFIPMLLCSLWTSMMLGAAEREAPDLPGKLAAVEGVARRPLPPGRARIAALSLVFTVIGYALVSLFPRYNFNQVLAAGYFMTLPGASNSMELRNSGVEAFGDSSPVLRVEPRSGQGSSVDMGLYARIHVLDRFDGKRFFASTNGALFAVTLPADADRSDADHEAFEDEDGPETVRVTLNRLTRDAVEHPLAVLGRTRASEIVRRNVRRTLGGSLVSGPFRGTALVYKARLDRPNPPAELPETLQSTEARTLLQLPDDLDPQIVDLGRKLTEGRSATRAKIDAVLSHFQRGFSYSLDPLPGQARDPLTRFLFQAKQGHCELFAAAVAVLLRVGGVKARVATGYYGGKWNALGGYLVYTQEDAHAWVEAFDDERGWIWVDATPEDHRVRRQPSALAVLRDWYDAIEAFWFEHVIDFDEARRKQLMGRMGRGLEDFSSLFRETEESERAEQKTRPSRHRAGLVGAILLGVGGVAMLVLFRARRRRGLEVHALGSRLRGVLGAKPGENATLGMLLDRLDPALLRDASRCIALYESLRFGASEHAPDPSMVLARIRELEISARALRG